MRIAVLVGLLIATAACGGYRFPGPAGGTGTVHGQVVAMGCGGPVQPAARPCLAKPTSSCPAQAADQMCGEWPIPGFELVFTKGGTSRIAKTDSAGAYSIDLPAGAWQVSVGNYGRIVQGPQTVTIAVGASMEADYVVDIGIRAAA